MTDCIDSASNDNIRLWNAAEAGEGDVRGRVQFKIIPGHHGGIVSQMGKSHWYIKFTLICANLLVL